MARRTCQRRTVTHSKHDLQLLHGEISQLLTGRLKNGYQKDAVNGPESEQQTRSDGPCRE